MGEVFASLFLKSGGRAAYSYFRFWQKTIIRGGSYFRPRKLEGGLFSIIAFFENKPHAIDDCFPGCA